jgi:hypothetical protein
MLGCKVYKKNKERDSTTHTSGEYQGKNTSAKPSRDIKEANKILDITS